MDLSFFATWYLNCEKYKIQTYPDLISTHALRQTDPKTRITLVSLRRSPLHNWWVNKIQAKLLRFGVRIEGPELDSVMIEHWPAITDKNRYEIYIYMQATLEQQIQQASQNLEG